MAKKTKEDANAIFAMPGGVRLVHVHSTSVSAGSKVVGMVVVAGQVTNQQSPPSHDSAGQQLPRVAASRPPRGTIGLHGTGHAWAPDRSLLRVDVINGRWTATRFRPDMTIHQEVVGSEEAVHEQVNRWAVGAE